MNEPSAVKSITSPATGTTYRLVIGDDGWRITKSLVTDSKRTLRHLRGRPGDAAIDTSVIDLLLRNSSDVPPVVGDPHCYFAAIVITDFDRTYHLLVALVKEAHRRMRDGTHGFRAGSPALKQDAKQALERAGKMCQAMAAVWKQSGLTVSDQPEWLVEALSK